MWLGATRNEQGHVHTFAWNIKTNHVTYRCKWFRMGSVICTNHLDMSTAALVPPNLLFKDLLQIIPQTFNCLQDQTLYLDILFQSFQSLDLSLSSEPGFRCFRCFRGCLRCGSISSELPWWKTPDLPRSGLQEMLPIRILCASPQSGSKGGGTVEYKQITGTYWNADVFDKVHCQQGSAVP